MKRMAKWLLSAAALASMAAAVTPASAQPYGYGDDGPPPFRRGPGWDGPPRGPWDRWHHHRGWRDEGFGRRGWRDGERREGRFGDEGRDRRFGGEDGRRGGRDGNGRDGDAPRRRGPDRNDQRSFGGDGN